MDKHGQVSISGAMKRALGGAQTARDAAQPGTALAVQGEAPRLREIGCRIDRTSGEVLLAPVSALPVPPPAAEGYVRYALLDAMPPPPLRGEDGRVEWAPIKPLPMAVPAEARKAAAGFGEALREHLGQVPTEELLRQWLNAWAIGLIPRQGCEDYDAWRRQQVRLLRASGISGIAFNDQTAALCGGRAKFLPTNAEITGWLSDWLAPWRDALVAAGQVAAAREPEPVAREAPPGQPVTPRSETDQAAIRAGAEARLAAIKTIAQTVKDAFPKPERKASVFRVYGATKGVIQNIADLRAAEQPGWEYLLTVAKGRIGNYPGRDMRAALDACVGKPRAQGGLTEQEADAVRRTWEKERNELQGLLNVAMGDADEVPA